jgi:hypothetical protein
LGLPAAVLEKKSDHPKKERPTKKIETFVLVQNHISLPLTPF